MDIEAIGQGRSGDGGEPVVADCILLGEGSQNGQTGRVEALHYVGAKGCAAALCSSIMS